MRPIDMLAAIQAIASMVEVREMTGKYQVSARCVEVKDSADSSTARSPFGLAETFDDAVLDLWRKLTEKVVLVTSGRKRRLLKWDRFMWADVPE